VGVLKRVLAIAIAGSTFFVVFLGVLIAASSLELYPPTLPNPAVPLFVLIQLGVPLAAAIKVWHVFVRRWSNRPQDIDHSPATGRRAPLVMALAIAYALTIVFGIPAVQSDQTAWAVAEYKRVKERGSHRVFESHPYIRCFATIPVAPGLVLTYHEYQLDGLYGLGAFELYLWYGVGTRPIGHLPLWIS
jgi:hypothetical protein